MNRYLSPFLKHLYLTLFLFLFTLILFGQTNIVPTINQKEEYGLTSKINKSKYQLFVSLPKNYSKQDTTKYPVLYILDGNYAFPIAHSTRQLLDLGGSIQDIIIVGIGYTWNRSYEPWFVNRWHDFTPSRNGESDTAQSFLGVLNLSKGSILSGGGQTFLQVMKKEIIPFIEANYNTNSDRGIAGHSLGGLFAAYCLLAEPTLFDKYSINSPSLWWNNRSIFENEKLFFEQNKELNAEVFISVGSREGPSMVTPMAAFSDSLKAHHYSGLTITSQVFENETHFSVLPATISRLLAVFYTKKRK